VILENEKVRAAAVTALAKFATVLEPLRPKIIQILQGCLNDTDDEVRDRATIYLQTLETQPQLANSLIVNVAMNLPLANLEEALVQYRSRPSDTPFDLNGVSLVVIEKPKKAAQKGPAPAATPAPAAQKAPVAASESVYQETLGQIPQFNKLGTLFKSSKPVELTEAETEYVVNCVKHIFQSHIVFQFNCTNTLNDHLLEHVSVKVESSSDEFTLESEISIPSLPAHAPGVAYVCFRRPTSSYISGGFSCILKFLVKSIDPSTGLPEDSGYEDEYQLEEIEVNTADYMQKMFVANFGQQWEELGPDVEVVETSSFTTPSMKTLADAVTSISDYLGMQPADKSEQVASNKNKHVLYLAGKFLGVKVLARARMKQETDGVSMELAVRSADPEISTAIVSYVA